MKSMYMNNEWMNNFCVFPLQAVNALNCLTIKTFIQLKKFHTFSSSKKLHNFLNEALEYQFLLQIVDWDASARYAWLASPRSSKHLTVAGNPRKTSSITSSDHIRWKWFSKNVVLRKTVDKASWILCLWLVQVLFY